MIHTGLSALLLIVLFRLICTEHERDFVNLPTSFGFVLVSSLLSFMLSVGLNAAGLSPALALLGYGFYFLVPFIVLKRSAGLPTSSATKLAASVLGVAIVAQIPFVVIATQ